MQVKNVLFLLVLLFLCVYSQSAKKQKGTSTSTSQPTDTNFIMTIVNTILGGPYDAPILTRLMNKVSHIATILFGSIFAYFKWFRQRKNRREKINEFIGDQKHKFAVIAEEQAKKIGEKEAQKIIYDLNSEKSRVMALRSNNGTINFNIDIKVEEAIEESILIYDIKMLGADPEGRSAFTGFVTFKDKLLQIRTEQTYEKSDSKKQEHPICLFEGKQIRVDEKLVQGEWWIENQRNTQGAYCGTFTFSF